MRPTRSKEKEGAQHRDGKNGNAPSKDGTIAPNNKLNQDLGKVLTP